jgi:hypothetical protein
MIESTSGNYFATASLSCSAIGLDFLNAVKTSSIELQFHLGE